jgi:hypothetical protein
MHEACHVVVESLVQIESILPRYRNAQQQSFPAAHRKLGCMEFFGELVADAILLSLD